MADPSEQEARTLEVIDLLEELVRLGYLTKVVRADGSWTYRGTGREIPRALYEEFRKCVRGP